MKESNGDKSANLSLVRPAKTATSSHPAPLSAQLDALRRRIADMRAVLPVSSEPSLKFQIQKDLHRER